MMLQGQSIQDEVIPFTYMKGTRHLREGPVLLQVCHILSPRVGKVEEERVESSSAKQALQRSWLRLSNGGFTPLFAGIYEIVDEKVELWNVEDGACILERAGEWA